MIELHSEVDFKLSDETKYSDWVSRVLISEGMFTGAVAYIFCTDDYLLSMNRKHLNHDSLTDIITFGYGKGQEVSGDIFISLDRVRENAETYGESFMDELHRVMAHGLLHLCGYDDKSDEEKDVMRSKEEEKMKLFHVEQ